MIDFFTLYTLLPFMLVLAVVYGAMETAGMFKNRALKAIISVVVALFGVIYPAICLWLLRKQAVKAAFDGPQPKGVPAGPAGSTPQAAEREPPKPTAIP